LDSLYIEILDSGGLDLEAWRPGCLDAARIGEDWRYVAARWEEGIGRSSYTLELEELGGYTHIS
jgi:hypothetical protein